MNVDARGVMLTRTTHISLSYSATHSSSSFPNRCIFPDSRLASPQTCCYAKREKGKPLDPTSLKPSYATFSTSRLRTSDLIRH